MSENTGCCYWLLRCFKGNSQENTDRPKIADKELNNQNEPVAIPIQENGQNSIVDKNVNHANLPMICTKFKLDNIISNITPDKIRDIKYNCPICLKFYNHILALQCCKNYICLSCITEHIDTSNKYSKQIKCPICTYGEKLYLEDVDPNAKVKIYSDTLYASFRNSIKKEMTVKRKSSFNTRKESKIRRVTTHHKRIKRRYSIENGELSDLNRCATHKKISVFENNKTLNPLKRHRTHKKAIENQSEFFHKPNLKATVEINNIELNINDRKSKSKINHSISHQSAYSYDDNFLSIHSEEIDEECEDFFFERDNDNNLIEILEEKIQNDIMKHEKKRNKHIIDSRFTTIKLKDIDCKSHDEPAKRNVVEENHRDHSVDNIVKSKKEDKNDKIDKNRMNHSSFQFDSKRTDNIHNSDEEILNEKNKVNENNMVEVEDMNEIIDNSIIDFDQIDQGSNNDFVNQSRNNIEKSEDISNNINKTDEVKFDIVSRKLNFDVIKID